MLMNVPVEMEDVVTNVLTPLVDTTANAQMDYFLGKTTKHAFVSLNDRDLIITKTSEKGAPPQQTNIHHKTLL